MSKYESIEAMEAAGRAIIREARTPDDSSTRVAILNVFNAYPMMAYTADKVQRIATVVEGIAFDPAKVSDSLKLLVREKVLRNRSEQGSRFYEINL